MDVLKVLYYGKLGKEHWFGSMIRKIGLLILLATVSWLIAWWTGLTPNNLPPNNPFWAIPLVFAGVFSLCVVISGCFAFCEMVGTLFVVRRFKKLFNFLPPTTLVGRDALQTNVDHLLWLLAKNFFASCLQEEELVRAIIPVPKTPIGASGIFVSPHEVAEMEIKLREKEAKLREHKYIIKYRKEDFWKCHKAARSGGLPVPFETCPSIKDYRELSVNGRAVCKERKKQKNAPPKGPRCIDGAGTPDPG